MKRERSLFQSPLSKSEVLLHHFWTHSFRNCSLANPSLWIVKDFGNRRSYACFSSLIVLIRPPFSFLFSLRVVVSKSVDWRVSHLHHFGDSSRQVMKPGRSLRQVLRTFIAFALDQEQPREDAIVRNSAISRNSSTTLKHSRGGTHLYLATCCC